MRLERHACLTKDLALERSATSRGACELATGRLAALTSGSWRAVAVAITASARGWDDFTESVPTDSSDAMVRRGFSVAIEID